jgi:hypothetical protein
MSVRTTAIGPAWPLEFFPEAEYTLLEPQEKLQVYIEDLLLAGKKINWISTGASETTETLPFYLSQRDDSSTFLQAAGEYAAHGSHKGLDPR